MKRSIPKLVLMIRVYSLAHQTAKTWMWSVNRARENKRALSFHFLSDSDSSQIHPVPLDPRLPCLVAEDLLDVCHISSLRCLQKVLLFPHGTWVGERLAALVQKPITIWTWEHARTIRHFVLRWLAGLAPVPRVRLQTSASVLVFCKIMKK